MFIGLVRDLYNGASIEGPYEVMKGIQGGLGDLCGFINGLRAVLRVRAVFRA